MGPADDGSEVEADFATALDELRQRQPESAASITGNPAAEKALALVTRASRALMRLVAYDAGAASVLADLDYRAPLEPSSAEEVAVWQKRELLRIAARDLTRLDSLEVVTEGLSIMASDVLRAACALAGGEALAVIGMGKLGAQELNYSSDIDVMVVGGEAPAARRTLEIARFCFRVDAALRPEGRDGPLTRSLESYEAYWQRWASHWEFQALLKSRPVAGDAALGAAFAAAAARHLWSHRFDAGALRELRDLKARAEKQLEQQGLTRREIKRGRGGIRDIEFAIQLLQLVHGGDDPALRAPATLTALDALAEGGYVAVADAATLAEAYRFLRDVEHRLQLVDLQQVHELPTDAEAMRRLALVMGFAEQAGRSATESFEAELTRHRAAARAIHERLFFRPLLEAFSGRAPTLREEAAAARISAFGFTELERTRAALTELSTGLTRSSRLMSQLLPLLLGWLSDSPDPDLGLLGLRAIAARQHGASRLTDVCRDSPEAARRLCLLLGTTPLLRAGFERHPQLLSDLAGSEPMRLPSRESLHGRARAAWQQGVDERRRGLRLVRDEEVARLAARDVLGLDDVASTARSLTCLAEVVLDAALTALEPQVPFAIVGMGRLGGGELGYASDLDVLFVHGGSTTADAAEAERVATELTRFVNGPTPAERLFEMDARLRPEGKQGPLARSLDGYRSYWQRWAKPWERQSLLRARPAAGDAVVGSNFMAAAADFVWGTPMREEELRELRRVKARVESERVPPGEDSHFHLKLGPGSLSDVEWTAQLLQLTSGTRGAATLTALDALTDAGALWASDRDVLAIAYRFCEHVRNRWFLVRGGPGDALPTDALQLSKLARSLGTTPAALRDEYRRITRRAREATLRLFYGK
ncbi:MAG TPA: bifunctional [glutamine synthetase] adenylyltransferase/[glutamine synthetase]-adenylyl-L-tyrosine phosphorylase [Acidimicrobiales bacterium]|nr:bifunctional [glutamine synthetase] adenylyltransferase/[glutamine synthetase]-adenylyl-L-tyrosine phosphorylase [Acidimicrobiales bacterium]